jgi:hypothetical protein
MSKTYLKSDHFNGGRITSRWGWERYVGRSGRVIGMKTFGASAPLKELQRRYGFEPERVTEVAKQLLGKGKKNRPYYYRPYAFYYRPYYRPYYRHYALRRW